MLKRRKAKGIDVMVYEPTPDEKEFFRSRMVRDLEVFKRDCDVIIANRPLATRHSPLATRHSPFAIRHSPFAGAGR